MLWLWLYGIFTTSFEPAKIAIRSSEGKATNGQCEKDTNLGLHVAPFGFVQTEVFPSIFLFFVYFEVCTLEMDFHVFSLCSFSVVTFFTPFPPLNATCMHYSSITYPAPALQLRTACVCINLCPANYDSILMLENLSGTCRCGLGNRNENWPLSQSTDRVYSGGTLSPPWLTNGSNSFWRFQIMLFSLLTHHFKWNHPLQMFLKKCNEIACSCGWGERNAFSWAYPSPQVQILVPFSECWKSALLPVC